MKNQLGPWRRSSIKAGEPNTPMVQDCLTALPLLTASAAKTIGVAVVMSKPIEQGSVSYHIEKDGVVTDTVTLAVGQSFKSFDTPGRTFPEETRFRILMSTSADLLPLDMDSRAWLICPA